MRSLNGRALIPLLLVTVVGFAACQSRSDSRGDFRFILRTGSLAGVCEVASLDWQSICHGVCPTRPVDDKLLTGHFAIKEADSNSKRRIAGIERCYAHCMRRYPPTQEHLSLFEKDITSFTCTERLNATICISACFHHFKDLFKFDNIHIPEGNCSQLCARDIQRGVCDRAFAPRNDSNSDADLQWCNQYCRNNTQLCLHMCSETITAINARTTENDIPSISTSVGILSRPSENFDLWSHGVLKYNVHNSPQFRKVYGMLWEVLVAVDPYSTPSVKHYIPQHMYLFYLPDEVIFYRPEISPTLLSLPKHQCKLIKSSFELVGEGELKGSQSNSVDTCVPGVPIPNPPNFILSVNMVNFVNLSRLIVHITEHSPERQLCDNYLLELYFIETGEIFHKNFSTNADDLVLEGKDLMLDDGRSILNERFDVLVLCVNWEEEENYGINPLDSGIFSQWSCDVPFKTALYCDNNIEIENPASLEPIPNNTAGLWGLSVGLVMQEALRLTKFLYLDEGRNFTFSIVDGNDEVLMEDAVALQIGQFKYKKTLPAIFKGGTSVMLRGTVGEESAGFKADTQNCTKKNCCISVRRKYITSTRISLSGIPPSPVRNITMVTYTINEVKDLINFTLSWFPPHLVAGNISMYEVKFGGSTIPVREVININADGSSDPTKAIMVNFNTELYYDETWNFAVRAVSVYGQKSSVALFTTDGETGPEPTSPVAQGPQSYVYIILAILLLIMLAVVITFTVLLIHFCRKNTKVVIASSMWTRGEGGEDVPMEPVISFEPDSWELNPDSITMENLLGEGSFGQVYKGVLRGPIRTPGYEANTSLTVAVKLLAMEASSSQKDEFLKEIELMKRVSLGKCIYIVNTIGCCTLQEPIALVMEYVPYGNLLGYLRTSRKLRPESGGFPSEEDTKAGNEYINHPGEEGKDWKTLHSDNVTNPYSHLGDLEPANLIKFAFQISTGMEYLSSIGVLHRDLACRNILVGEQKMLKICDFGLARENDLYIKTTAGKLPLRWMAIESITERVFTSKSDVWSFGVTIWEIATLGGCPYPAVTNHSLVNYIWNGNRLEKPNNCSMDVYQVMLQCWKARPEDRPTFTELRSIFEAMVNREKNYIDLNDEFLPYYPMSAVCDTTDDSLENTEGQAVSPSPMDYEIPLTFKSPHDKLHIEGEPSGMKESKTPSDVPNGGDHQRSSYPEIRDSFVNSLINNSFQDITEEDNED